MNCPEASRLLEEYTSALAAFHKAQEPLPAGMGPGDPADNRTRIDREEAHYDLARARGVYWKHVQMHRCRSAHSLASGADEVLARLRAQLTEARKDFDAASLEYNHLIGIAADASGTADGVSARMRAREIHATVYQAYQIALKNFADYVLKGSAPHDD